MAFDARLGEVVLFGGSAVAENDASILFDDLWSWNGKRWRQMATTGSARSSHRLLYDSSRQQLISVGGFDGRQAVGEVRALDGQQWRLLTDTPAIAGLLADPAVTWDPRRNRIVLYGGLKPDRSVSGETWEFDGNAWNLVASTGPGPLSAALMVYDEARGVTVLWGGRNDKRALNEETWQWDGTSWRRIATTGPPPRFAAGFVFDSKRGQAVLFGGGTSNGRLADTWLWDGTRWEEARVTGPSGRLMPALAYDRQRAVVVLFGGRIKYPEDSNETWEWDGKQWSYSLPRIPAAR